MGGPETANLDAWEGRKSAILIAKLQEAKGDRGGMGRYVAKGGLTHIRTYTELGSLPVPHVQ